ncbi:DUF2345 domain-containing protein, partial [Iodobacter sp. CM08]|uniref:DUF2345 domain-containing protein n=1 Tax=Iodobacter sp. CM08 TaxID=3085902 RepID=UPI002980CBAA
AAKGKIQLQAQSDDIEITADKNIKITACKEKVEIAAGDEVLFTSGGGYIRLKGGNIEIHCPGEVSIKGASHELSGPASMNLTHQQMVASIPQPFSTKVVVDKQLEEWLGAGGSVPYQLINQDGEMIGQGSLDEYGRTKRVFQSTGQPLKLLLGERGPWLVDQTIDDDSHSLCGCGGEHFDEIELAEVESIPVVAASNLESTQIQIDMTHDVALLKFMFDQADVKKEVENGEE